METKETLYKAILLNPDDDLPRKVYADYCEENGDEDTAKFIKMQLGLVEWDAAFCITYMNEFTYFTPNVICNFIGGFPGEIRCTETAWIEKGPEIVSQYPIRQVLITDKEPMEHDSNLGRLGLKKKSYFAWHRVDEGDTEPMWMEIHDRIYERLINVEPRPRSKTHYKGRGGCAVYKTSEDARKAYPAAALMYARDKARIRKLYD